MTDKAISPLRRRMIEDMTIRKFVPKTHHDYVQRVKNFAVFLGRSPATASKEDVRRFQLHLASNGAAARPLSMLPKPWELGGCTPLDDRVDDGGSPFGGAV